MNDTERAGWDETKLNMKTMGDCLNGGTLVARFLATREAARGVYMARPGLLTYSQLELLVLTKGVYPENERTTTRVRGDAVT